MTHGGANASLLVCGPTRHILRLRLCLPRVSAQHWNASITALVTVLLWCHDIAPRNGCPSVASDVRCGPARPVRIRGTLPRVSLLVSLRHDLGKYCLARWLMTKDVKFAADSIYLVSDSSLIRSDIAQPSVTHDANCMCRPNRYGKQSERIQESPRDPVCPRLLPEASEYGIGTDCSRAGYVL